MHTYTWPADTVANTIIIKWDLSAISTDATVTEATLYLYQTDSGGDSSYDVGVHKIGNVNPVISACTWNTYDGTNSWTGGADGGQGDTAAAEDTPSLNSTNNEYKTWTVTNMVADWVSAPSSNYGMLVNSDDVASVDSFRYFASTEDSNTPFRPKLIVTYISGGQASNPSPADSAADVSVDTDLSWTPGEYADTHDVYLGTDVNAVADANQSSDDTTTWPGDVWGFTTEAQQPPAQASSPSPADSAVDVSITADLSWTAGTGATSHDVYFGTTSPGSFQGNQTATTFDPGTMANDTAYYWRIDEVNGGGTTTGTVWSFTTIIAAPGQASNPSPADSAVDVDIDADLSWTPGSGSTSSDVYFGTDSTPDSGEFQGNQTATTYDPGTLANGATYYWRIDEVNAGGTTTGTVWSFTTIVAVPGQASSPSPADTATDIAVSADLSWTAGSGSTSSDVYFGTTSPGAFQGNQTATTFDPGTMTNDTTYYWRIDEINAGGTTTGAVWSFTTEAAPQPPGQATNPSPADSATNVTIDADLSWTAGSGSTSSDVYFGTTSPGSFQGNQTTTTFDPGTMANDTTYYWRIDEINAVGTTTGTVWSFTTVAGGGPVTEEFGDATNTDYPGTIEDTWTNSGGPTTNNSTATRLNTYTWPADTVACKYDNHRMGPLRHPDFCHGYRGNTVPLPDRFGW
ncbi:MAG: DNRLRE domain-containing protein [Planctomycetota bacterium]